MLTIQKFIDANYDSSIDFFRDALAYLNSRVESRNEGKPIVQLLMEYVEIRNEFIKPD